MDNVVQFPSEFARVLRELRELSPEEREVREQEVLDSLEAAFYADYDCADEY